MIPHYENKDSVSFQVTTGKEFNLEFSDKIGRFLRHSIRNVQWCTLDETSTFIFNLHNPTIKLLEKGEKFKLNGKCPNFCPFSAFLNVILMSKKQFLFHESYTLHLFFISMKKRHASNNLSEKQIFFFFLLVHNSTRHCKCEIVNTLVFSRVSLSAALQWQFRCLIV